MTGRSEPRSARKSQLSAIPQRNADADGRRPVWNSERQPTTDRLIDASSQWAERIMQEIDRRWPAIQSGTSRTVRRE